MNNTLGNEMMSQRNAPQPDVAFANGLLSLSAPCVADDVTNRS